MSKPCGWSVLLFVVVSLLTATTPVEGQIAKWNFANFSSALPIVSNLIFLDDSSIFNATGPPRLVLNSMGTLTGVATVGRAVFSNKVQFKEDITRSFASFTTNFTFAINNLGSIPAGCGGFAFQIRADNSSVGQSGEYLGLTTATSDGAGSNSLFAVEFDTSLDVDVGDQSGSHIGVDLNSVKSTSIYNLCPSASNCTSLVNNGMFFSKITYNGTQDSLQVELRNASAMTTIANWTVSNVSLQPAFREYMYVGFSGSNGVGCNQTHEIFSWGFSTSRSSSSTPGSAEGPSAPHVSYKCYRFNGCRNYRALVIGLPAAVGGTAIIFLVICVYCCYFRRKQSTPEYAAVENMSNSGPKGADALLASKSVKAPDVEAAPPLHKLPPVPPPAAAAASEIDLPLRNTKGKNGVNPITEQSGISPALVTPTVAKAVEPKSVNRDADVKVVMCCVQTKPKRDYKEPVVFSLKELAQATKNFSDKEVIGGTPERRPVYRGVLRDNGAVVAIKELKLDNISNEFVTKAMVLGRIRHPNLVHLLGWCKCPEKSKLYLVYDYMPRGSLDKLLILSNDEEGFLGFDERYNVLTGVAAGLTYLHEEWEQCVLHRDVKPSNVLLDVDCNAHLGNFSHASLVDHNKLAESTVLDGTLGYMAPEISFTGKPTVKSDVFSFGILTLAVACGRLPLDWQVPQEERVLLDSVWRAHEQGDLLRTVDKRLQRQSSGNQSGYTEKRMTTLLHVGLACAHPDPSMRPNMAFVWQILFGRAQAPELPATKPVVENYAALSSLGLMRTSLGSRSSDPPPPQRFPGMDQTL